MKQRTQDDFDLHATTYREAHDRNVKMSGAGSADFASMKVEVVTEFEREDSLQLLDLGCGDGLTCRLFYERKSQWEITGLDVSEKSIEIAQAKIAQPISFVHYDGQRIPYGDHYFDLVFVACVLHHIDFGLHEDVLREIHRVLKPGGRLYVFEHNPYNPVTRHLVNTCEFDEQAVLLKPGYAGRLLKRSGFGNVRKRFYLFFPRFRWMRWLWPLEKKIGWLPLGGQYFFRSEKAK